jgi:iron(III) transport system permease protein
MGRSLKATLQRREQELALAVVAAVLVLVAFLPLVSPAFSLGARSGTNVEGVSALLGRRRLWHLLSRSVLLSSAVATASVAIGAPLGLLLAKTNAAGRKFLSLALALPVSLPPFLLVLGWYDLFGRSGRLGSAATSDWLFSDAGALGVLSLAFAPIAVALTGLGARGVDPSLEDAARVVASPLRVVVRILIPAIWPSIALAAVIVFALTFSELGVPMFLRRDVYPAAVFARLGGVDYQPGEALVLTIPLLPIAFFLLALERLIFRRRSFAVLGASRSRASPLPLGRWLVPASAVAWLVAVIAVMPIGALVAKAGRSGLVEALYFAGGSVVNSLVASSLAAGVIGLMALVLGHAIARGYRGSTALDGLSMLAFVTPAAVLGTGLVTVLYRPMTQWLYESFAVVVIGFVARYSAVGVRTMAVAVAQSSPSFEESASVFGARYFRRLVGVVLPVHQRSVLGAGLLALLFCLRDLETAVLFYPPGGQPLTVTIFTLEANGSPRVVAGLAVMQVLMTAAVLIAGALLFAGKPRQ